MANNIRDLVRTDMAANAEAYDLALRIREDLSVDDLTTVALQVRKTVLKRLSKPEKLRSNLVEFIAKEFKKKRQADKRNKKKRDETKRNKRDKLLGFKTILPPTRLAPASVSTPDQLVAPVFRFRDMIVNSSDGTLWTGA
jgi:hypothetical protein